MKMCTLATLELFALAMNFESIAITFDVDQLREIEGKYIAVRDNEFLDKIFDSNKSLDLTTFTQ